MPLQLFRRFRAVLVVLTASFLTAEYPPVKAWTSADGLAGDSEIGFLLQDSRGYLWIGGALGLSRFDGHAFRNYGKADGLPSEVVYSGVETKDGTLWFGTSRGLVRYVPDAGAPKRFAGYPFDTPDGREVHTIQSLAEDPRGGLWIGTPVGLFHASPSRDGGTHARRVLSFEEPGGKEPAGVGRILTLLSDSRGVLWAGTHYSGIFRILPGENAPSEYRTEHYTVANGLPSNVSGSLLEDHLGRIWFATPHGLLQLSSAPDPARPIVLRAIDSVYGLPENMLFGLAETRDGHIWIGSPKGLAEFDGRRLRTLTTENGLSGNSIFSLLTDRQGNLWAGTQSSGVMRIARNGFTSFRAADGLTLPSVSTLTESHGRSLLAVMGSPHQLSLGLWDGGAFRNLQPRFPKEVTSFGWGAGQQLLQDHVGESWVATFDGLCRFPRTGSMTQLSGMRPVRRYTTHDGLPGDNIYSLFEDTTGDIWIGVAFHTGQHAGLARWNRREDRIEDFNPGPLKDHPATSFAEDASGAVWIGFGDGRLGRYRHGGFALFGEREGVPPGVIHLYLDSADRLWGAADAGGVFRVEMRDTDHPGFVRFTTENGLSSDSVFTLTSDVRRRIYAGTRRGIDRIEPSTGKIAHFTTADGLANSVVISSFRDHDGDLWFGTLNGLSKLTASRDLAPPPPAVRITEIRVDNRPIPLSDFGETTAGSVQLHARQNHVQISFAGINLDSDLRFQYRLEGSNSEWSEPGAQQSVIFPGFPDGNYRFLVRALNSDDEFGKVAAVSFYVLPPLWQRWWFILIAAAGIGAAIWQWQRLRLHRLLEVERLRTRIATDLHDDIGTNLSHIAVLSELARRGIGESEYLSQIATVSQETAAAIGDVVWAINPQRDSLNDLVLRMRRFASDVLSAREIEVRFGAPDAEGSRKLDSDLRRQLYLVFKEAVNNAARHAQATRVEIDLRLDGHTAILEISDNGRGFDPAGAWPGNGLNSLQSRAQRLAGTFSIESGKGNGTRLIFRAPL